MLDLIERAASAVSYELISRWRTSKRFVIFAGPGDNGADALAVARMMFEQGYRPEVYLFNIKSAKLSPCCLTNRDRLLATVGDQINFVEVIQTFSPPQLDENDVVVDGLLGSIPHHLCVLQKSPTTTKCTRNLLVLSMLLHYGTQAQRLYVPSVLLPVRSDGELQISS